jgi:hypothetical protein
MDMMPPQKDGNATNTEKLLPLIFTDDKDHEDQVIWQSRVIG